MIIPYRLSAFVRTMLALLVIAVFSTATFAQSSRSSRSDDDDDVTESERESPLYRRESQEPQTQVFGPTVVQDQRRTAQDRYYEQLLEEQQQISAAQSEDQEPAEPGEFEQYVATAIGRPLPRFGSEFLIPKLRDFSRSPTATIPADYRLKPGDIIILGLAGSVQSSLELLVDTNGNIFIPSVGSVRVSGIRYGDLGPTLRRSIGSTYSNFEVDARVGEVRGIKVFVTGFAQQPGSYTLDGLATIVNGVMQAGGPSAGGSFRHAKVYRGGREVADFDLYDFIRGGVRTNDAVLQDEDVLFIPPVGEQVAVVGSVQSEAIFEVKGGETVADMIRMAGGLTDLADDSRFILYRLGELASRGAIETPASAAATTVLRGGDIVQILSEGSIVQPTAEQSVVVRIEGEVERPGDYFLAPGTSMAALVDMAGGLTYRAFPYGTNFTRQSVRQQQLQSYEDALDQLEMAIATAPLTRDTSVSAADQQTMLAGARETLDALREEEPDGRVVLTIAPADRSLPSDLILENNDRVVIPPRPSTVGVFGAVYRPASFLYGEEPLRVRDYLDMAGGPIRAGDKGRVFVIRANGEVLPKKAGALSAVALPGDVIFVPIKTTSTDLLARIQQISSTIFQFGLSAATVVAVTK